MWTELDEDRIISPELTDINEERLENSLRPKTLQEYIGQDKVKENMKILLIHRNLKIWVEMYVLDILQIKLVIWSGNMILSRKG